MPSQFAVGLRACCVAVALVFAMAHAAEQKSSLIGATRDQVLERLGEPRGVLTAGNREVITFDRQRVTLRDGVVVSVETLAAAPAPTPPPAADTTAAPTAGAQPAPAAGATTAPTEPGAPAAAPTESRPPPPATTPARTPQFSIKSVRPPGSPRPAPKEQPKQEPAAPATAVPPSSSAIGQAEQAAKAAAPAESQVAPTTAAPSLSSTPAPATVGTAPLPAVATAPATDPTQPPPDSPEAKKAAEDEATAKSDEKAKTKAKAKAPVRPPPGEDVIADPPIFTTKTVVIGLVVIGAVFAFVMWLRRQRQLELAASSVSRTPFMSGGAGGGGARFGADLLAKLEWKRFEELVALYYSKTGVVAARTKTGPATPVHIKISWKGEPRPFAYVQCIPYPTDLIEAEPLHALVAALAADDIRRGYVVTTGRFSVAARDVAEEKHLTLLPGDILLEKLNALPDAARSEILQEITAGDYQTPSCPKCEAKMVRSDTGVWRCAQHPEVTVPGAR